MEVLFSKSTKSNLYNLGLYQIIGGVLGVLIIIWVIFKSQVSNELTVLVYLVMILFFCYSIFCGMLCIQTKKNALIHSLTNQILQLFGIAIMGYAFKYIAGLYLTIGLDLKDSIEFKFGAGISKFDFNINNERERLELDFNLVALALIYWIDKCMKKVKEEENIRHTSSIGDT